MDAPFSPYISHSNRYTYFIHCMHIVYINCFMHCVIKWTFHSSSMTRGVMNVADFGAFDAYSIHNVSVGCFFLDLPRVLGCNSPICINTLWCTHIVCPHHTHNFMCVLQGCQHFFYHMVTKKCKPVWMCAHPDKLLHSSILTLPFKLLLFSINLFIHVTPSALLSCKFFHIHTLSPLTSR